MNAFALNLINSGPMVVQERHRIAAMDITQKQSTPFLLNWKSALLMKMDPDGYNYGFVKMHIELIDAELTKRNIPHNK